MWHLIIFRTRQEYDQDTMFSDQYDYDPDMLVPEDLVQSEVRRFKVGEAANDIPYLIPYTPG